MTKKERIINRVVKIWIDLLKDPKYDNGDKSFSGFMASSMADKISKNNNKEILEKFGKELKKILCDKNIEDYKKTYLNVDYHPCEVLSDAANKAGLKMKFPWKTNISYEDDYVRTSIGYQSETTYHYPIENNKWLITTLCGSEIDKVIEYVNGGKPKFKVED